MLPPSFWNFIVRTGPIDPRILEAVRNNCRDKPFDADKVATYLSKVTPKGQPVMALTDTLPGIIPCSILHPHTASCSANSFRVFSDSFRKTFPLYASLTLLPTFVLRFGALLRHPLTQVMKAARSAGQSTTFLAAFVALYQVLVCVKC